MTIIDAPASSSTSVLTIIQQQVTAFRQNLPRGSVVHGLAVGAITPGQGAGAPPTITPFYDGYANVAANTPVGEKTVFEIGSVTKTFTTTMLAARAQAGEIDLNEPAQTYYDRYVPGVKLPVYTDPQTNEVYPMRMVDLADFTSGIPDKSPTNTRQPNQYTFTLLHQYLNDSFPTGLPVRPGTEYRYVNTNFGIIAELLMAMGGYDEYGGLLQQLITDGQLVMPGTGVITSNHPVGIPGLAQGYNSDGTPNPNFALPTWPALQGAGGIYATLQDMLFWLRFNMGLAGSPLNGVLAFTHHLYFGSNGVGEGLGWFITRLNGATMIDKNGGTSGFHSWIGFLPDSGCGVVVLSNVSMRGAYTPDKLGTAILGALPG